MSANDPKRTFVGFQESKEGVAKARDFSNPQDCPLPTISLRWSGGYNEEG